MTLLIIGFVLCILLSAFFSASEMSFSSSSDLRLENLRDEGNKKAARACKIKENFDDALGAILIGNNLVNIASSSIGSVLTIELLKSDKYAWASTVLVTVLVIIFGETIPKIIAKKKANSMTLVFSLPIRILTVVLKPVIWLVVSIIGLITKNMRGEEEPDEEEAIDEAIDELSSIIETAEDEEVLDEDQSELVQAAIDFLDVSAVEVMTSRVDLVAIDLDDDLEEIRQTLMEAHYSRIPVYEDSIDNIQGVLYLNHYLKARTESDVVDIRSLLMPPCFVYKTTLLTSVLDQLRDAQQHLAIVCDEYGGTLGIVTMEDILEEIVGDIWDESDEVEEEIKEITETTFELDGDLPIAELCDLLDRSEDEFDTESETVGGWALEHFDIYPENGAEFTEDNLHAKILEIEDRRVIKLFLEKLPEEE